MDIRIVDCENDYRLVFEGAMTRANSRELEDKVIDLMRRHRCLRIDLSGVHEIDLFGIHLIGVLRHLGGRSLEIVAASPTVERALARLPEPRRNAAPGQPERRRQPRQMARL